MVTTLHKPVLIVIAGPNGSGKTTITTQILQHEWMENSILNCRRVSLIAYRSYIYDNSIDNQEARLLFRMVDGKVFKRYFEELPNWVHTIIS